MQITKEFLIGEIAELEQELQKASSFVVQAQATISAYQMLLRRLDEPEPVQPIDSGAAHG
jgi:hypothetical protein